MILVPTMWKLKFATNSSVANVFVKKLISPTFVGDGSLSFTPASDGLLLGFFLSSFSNAYDQERQTLESA